MILCGCGVEKQSSCDEVIEARWARVHVWYDGCQEHVLDVEVGDRRDENGENVQLGEERCLWENGDEICEASLDPDIGEELARFVRA